MMKKRLLIVQAADKSRAYITMGEMLIDLGINYAQKLLKSQFPGINGLYLTCSQMLIKIKNLSASYR